MNANTMNITEDDMLVLLAEDFDFLERMTNNVTIGLNDIEGVLAGYGENTRTDCIKHVTLLKLQCDKIINRVNEYKK